MSSSYALSSAALMDSGIASSHVAVLTLVSAVFGYCMCRFVVHRAAIEHSEAGRRSLKCIRDMEAALGANSNTMKDHFHETFRWMGNRGCGTKMNLQEFRDNWQLPLRAAFTERTYKTEKFLVDGNWAACFGKIEGTHSGEFMGIPATGKRVTVPYMDFWLIEDGRIKDNWVSVDYAQTASELGWDVFDGQGWEAYDSKKKVPPKPAS